MLNHLDNYDGTLGLPCWDTELCSGGWGAGGGSWGGGTPGGTFTQPPVFTGYGGGYNTVIIGGSGTTNPPITAQLPQTTASNTPLAQPQTQPAPQQIVAGIDNKTLLIIGVGLLGVIVLTR